MESVAAVLWNQWQLSGGTGGSFGVESVAGFTWNRWQLSRGIRKLLYIKAYQKVYISIWVIINVCKDYMTHPKFSLQ
jgi:hypothetical protein